MVIHDIKDISEISSFIDEWEKGCMVTLRNILVNPYNFIMSHRDKSIYFIVERRSSKVAVIHMYCDKKSRGKKMINFINEVRNWIKDNTEIKFIFNYTEDFKAKMIMSYAGSKNIGTYKGYTVYKQSIKR